MNFSSIQNKIKQNKGVKKLQEIWDENPLLVIGVAVAAMSATAKLVDAISSAKSKKAYAHVMMRSSRTRQTW